MEIKVNITRSLERMSIRGMRQIPFAFSVALNDTAKAIQRVQREHMTRALTIRRPFALTAVAIERDDWARKDRLRARVRIGPSFGSSARDRFARKLARHERGGTLHAGAQGFTRDGHAHWIPAREGRLREPATKVVPQRMWPSALGLWRTDAQSGAGTGGRARRQGKHRTFAITSRHGELVGIYQRYGMTDRDIAARVRAGKRVTRRQRHDGGIRLLWRYQPSIRLRPRLQFFPTARRVAASSIAGNLARALRGALATAR